MIVPAVFAFSGGNTDALNAGPGLMFITLPKVFASMPFGSVLGTAFFHPRIFCRSDLFHLPDGNDRFDLDGLFPLGT